MFFLVIEVMCVHFRKFGKQRAAIKLPHYVIMSNYHFIIFACMFIAQY